MADTDNVLTPAEAQAYYDRFGKKQDSQGFYEDPALDELIAHGDFANARSVFEFGCGTGKLAQRLLAGHLPAEARYLGCDISPVMLELSQQRLAAYSQRAQVVRSTGPIQFPPGARGSERILCCYVLDLLSPQDIQRFFSEAQRVLQPDGLLCLASLGKGSNRRSRLVASVWSALFRLNPALVGGCRPLQLQALVDRQDWQILHQALVAPYGVPSEVLILQNIRAAAAEAG